MGNHLPTAMGPLTRVRASQLQQCLAKGSEPTEAVIQATLDLIAVGQGPADPLPLANAVSMVSQTPDVQLPYLHKIAAAVVTQPRVQK